jgi:hypothetical protein
MTVHASHPDIRLKRAAVAPEKYHPCSKMRKHVWISPSNCTLEKAVITNAKRTLIHDHLDHCPEDALHADPFTRSLIRRLANLKR